jgi:hypothetical protein
MQGAARRDGRVELTQRAGRGIAGIGERPLPALFLIGIQTLEGGAAHVNLAAHLEQFGEALGLHLVRNVGNCADISRDILALIAIAAGRSLHEAAAFVAERDREPIDLRFDGEVETFEALEPKKTPDTL